MHFTRLTALAVVFTAASTQAVQLNEGPVVAAPCVFGVDETTFSAPGVPIGAKRMQRKRAGFDLPAFPIEPITGAEPDFDELPFLNQVFFADAFSIGQDVINATPPNSGVSFIDVPPMGWGAIAFSVSRATKGEPGSVMFDQYLKPDGTGGDIYSFTLPGSTFASGVAPCYPTDTAQLAQDSPSIGLFDGTSQGEMTYLDLYVPAYMAGSPARDFVPDQPVAFFSVRDEDAHPRDGSPSLVPAGWFDDGSPQSGATILMTRWIMGVGGGFWTTPKVHLNYDELGLQEDDDIDALAVSQAQCLALFSIVNTGGGLAEQLQVVKWGCGSAWAGGGVEVGEYRDQSTMEPVARSMDIEADGEIDGLCTIDPSDQELGSCGPYYGWPTGKSAFKKELAAQVYRDDAATLPTATLVIDGISPAYAGKRLHVYVLVNGFAPIKVYDELIVTTTDPTRTIPFASPFLGGSPGGASLCMDFAAVIVPAPKVGAVISGLRLY